MQYATHLVDAHRPAMDIADNCGLPQTVFYHPDHGFTNTEATSWKYSGILRDKQTKLHVTWLPTRYFD